MDILIILLILISLWGFRLTKHNHDYIGRESTTAIKGIFAIFILFNHSRQYIPDLSNVGGGNLLDSTILYDWTLSFLGQLMVVMFLTYSGYGIMESVKHKSATYLNGFMRKRVLKTLVHFDIAVFMFLCVALCLEHEYAPIDYFLCWTGWTSIGNSNWFIFDIIILYLLSCGGLLFARRVGANLRHYAWGIMIVSIAFFAVMYKAKPGQTWWCDTVISFPIGMIWSVYREKLEQILENQKNYVLALMTVIICFAITYWFGRHIMLVMAAINAIFFALLVILLTMRLRVGNPILHWLGVNAFAIYILQRIPMIIAKEYGFHEYPLLFAVIVIPATLLLAAVFTASTNSLDRKYFR